MLLALLVGLPSCVLATTTAKKITITDRGDVCNSSPTLFSIHFPQCPVQRDRLIQHALPCALPPRAGLCPTKCLTAHEADKLYCTYTSRTFAAGRGISIITSPQNMETFRNVPAFADAEVPAWANQNSSLPCREVEIPGKGRGLVASKMLHRGDRILASTPLVLLHLRSRQPLDGPNFLELKKAAVDGLPSRTKKLFWDLGKSFAAALCQCHDGHATADLAKRINHDCRPNAAYFFDPETFTHHVHALTTIPTGTEITVSYIDPSMLRRRRRDELFSTWGFRCSCSSCTAHPALTTESDDRLEELASLQEQLEEEWPTAPPEMAETLISLHEQERLHGPISWAYQLAALTHCANGNYWTTKKYARLAIEVGTLDVGFGIQEDDQLRVLAERPKQEACWQRRMLVD
ncbi:hypothetical protein DCS_03508 [Drechmeria coniospora]|uniref:SET domain-containing protein n=1 Tax=Drechmeria coniospora TaxID=98403 RepID=A0A151GHF6_DRECN|nr:hypothetical protein DCS_03508 [Drechmeria coniospora]KYK56508.1 hypothetical protein DCS_03508 [Drechmeria coniospora]